MPFDVAALPPLREVVERFGLNAQKSLGQNFLFDRNLTDKIVRSAQVRDGVHVLEIGPGPGGLTRSLLGSPAAAVIAIEKDERCVVALQELQSAAQGRLQVHNADALKTDLVALAPAPRMLVANLPYNVATELLFSWLDIIHLQGPSAFDSLTLMFQKEVAERIAAKPGSKAYGRLSIVAQWLCDVQLMFDIPPAAFRPVPKVTSTVIRIVPRAQPLAIAQKPMLEKVVQAAFGQRRKMLRSSLKSLGVPVEELLAAAAIDGSLRAEQLNIAQFCDLANAMKGFSQTR